jgi:hypothetical protein
MTDSNTLNRQAADEGLAQLRARVADQHANAVDWLAFGHALLRTARNKRDAQSEALAALVRAY